MTTATPVMGSSHAFPSTPSISISISTRSPTFDLSLTTPFIITATLTLHHHRPITFHKRDAQLFKLPRYSPGLEFINVRTRITQTGMSINICYIASNESELPEEANLQEWITLYPDQPYVLDASIKPYGGERGRMRTLAEWESGPNERSTTLKWPMVHRLLDGEEYEITLSDKAKVERWIEGDLGEILEWIREGRAPTLLEKPIGFDVKGTTRFIVKRPDADGSLNWP